MSLISPTFATELNEKEMRDAYLSAQTRTHLSHQIRTIRSQRGWSQEEFAEKMNTSQSAVSRMEDRQYGKQNLQTLIQVANTFDCGLLVQFVPYDEFILRTNDMSQEALAVPKFESTALLPLAEDLPTIELKPDYFGSWEYTSYNTDFPPATSLLTYSNGLLKSGSQLPSAVSSSKPDMILLWIDDPQHVQGGQTNVVLAASVGDLEAENARLKAENARLKAEKERLSSAPTALFLVNQRPSQLPGF